MRVQVHKPRVATTDTRRVRPPSYTAEVDAELSTMAHRVWREKVKERAGYRCEAAWHNPRRPREGVKLYADHIIERKDGGALFDLGNGMCVCSSCHQIKTAQRRRERLAGAHQR